MFRRKIIFYITFLLYLRHVYTNIIVYRLTWRKNSQICILICYMYMLKNYTSAINWDDILNMITQLSAHCIMMLLVTCSSTFFPIYRREIFHILTSLIDIEKELKQMRIAVDYRVVRMYCWAQITTSLCLLNYIIILHIINPEYKISLVFVIIYLQHLNGFSNNECLLCTCSGVWQPI